MERIKVFAINTSPRKGRNTEQLLDEVLAGCLSMNTDGGVHVSTKLMGVCDAAAENFKMCRGCWACAKTGQCVCGDDFIKDVYDENRILKEKIDSYVNVESENEVLQSEIKKLKKLTEMDYLPNDYKTKAASVQIRDQTNWNDEITIDAGSLNNVQEGMAVCDSKGMIGVVSHVTEISSTVSLLTSENPSNQIPVMIINGDQTIYGLLKNYDVNKKVLNITLLSGIDKLEKNAKVYTSGLGGDGKCPKGIYIGKAKKLVTQSDGTTMTLTVKMAAQFKDLSYVSVVKKVNGNEE